MIFPVRLDDVFSAFRRSFDSVSIHQPSSLSRPRTHHAPLLLSATLDLSAETTDDSAAALAQLHDAAQERLAARWREDRAQGPALDLVMRCDQAFGIHPLILRLPWRPGIMKCCCACKTTWKPPLPHCG